MDYRDIPPEFEHAFDAFISVEMLEHVGSKVCSSSQELPFNSPRISDRNFYCSTISDTSRSLISRSSVPALRPLSLAHLSRKAVIVLTSTSRLIPPYPRGALFSALRTVLFSPSRPAPH